MIAFLSSLFLISFGFLFFDLAKCAVAAAMAAAKNEIRCRLTWRESEDVAGGSDLLVDLFHDQIQNGSQSRRGGGRRRRRGGRGGGGAAAAQAAILHLLRFHSETAETVQQIGVNNSRAELVDQIQVGWRMLEALAQQHVLLRRRSSNNSSSSSSRFLLQQLLQRFLSDVIVAVLVQQLLQRSC